jgi:hypothetical protein
MEASIMSQNTGWSKEREREYNGLVEGFEKEGRYQGREEEVAARIVNKQRAEYGETQQAQVEDEHGESPDRSLPIDKYDTLTIEEIESRLGKLSKRDLGRIAAYERKQKDRKSVLEVIERERGS